MDDRRWERFLVRRAAIEEVRGQLKASRVCLQAGEGRISGWDALRRQNMTVSEILAAAGLDPVLADVATALEVEAHYQGYLEK
ncbi:MAG: hypothetical protein H7833_21320, partial [Magnetococcus sp. DMHC-1]